MISLTTTPTARYLVAIQTYDGDRASLVKVFCDSVAEARKTLVKNWRYMSKGTTAHLCTINGYKPGNLPAAMIAYESKRYGRCLVGKAQWAGGRAELVVIALK